MAETTEAIELVLPVIWCSHYFDQPFYPGSFFKPTRFFYLLPLSMVMFAALSLFHSALVIEFARANFREVILSPIFVTFTSLSHLLQVHMSAATLPTSIHFLFPRCLFSCLFNTLTKESTSGYAISTYVCAWYCFYFWSCIFDVLMFSSLCTTKTLCFFLYLACLFSASLPCL